MKASNAARSRSRRFLVQALYQAQMTGEAPGDVLGPFVAERNMKRADMAYFREVLGGIHREMALLQKIISQPLDRGYDELDPVETAILQLGTYELLRQVDVPYRVVINESIELAKLFGATESHRYVNSILDRIAREYRSMEIR